MPVLRIVSLILVALLYASCFAQPAANDSITYNPIVHHISISSGFDYFASSVTDELRIPVEESDKVYTHSAIPLSLKYSFSFANPSIRNYYPGGYQGLAVNLLNLGAASSGGISKSRHFIGYPVSVYLFQGAPFLRMPHNLSLDYEWNFGAAFGWKPYNLENYNYNLTVGSKVNAYLNLSLFLRWECSKRLSLFGGVALTHFSNGNTSWPNPGVNAIGFRIGADYTINPLGKKFPDVEPDTVKKKLFYDISIWAASRKRAYKGMDKPILLQGHFICSGISFAPMVALNRWIRIGGSADLQYDQSSDKKRHYISGTTSEDIKFSDPDFFRQISLGISAHGELQMPIFAVNIGIGYNIFAPKENRGTYQNITLKTYLCPIIYLNVGYQLRNFHQQANLMLGLGFSL